jgi:hypothetical protein
VLNLKAGCTQADSIDAFMLLVVHAYMTKLQQASPNDKTYAKYPRSRLIIVFDSLGKKNSFKNKLSLSDFPLRRTHASRKRGAGDIINLDEDSDASLSSEFYNVSPSSPDSDGEDEDDNLDLELNDTGDAEEEGQHEDKDNGATGTESE